MRMRSGMGWGVWMRREAGRGVIGMGRLGVFLVRLWPVPAGRRYDNIARGTSFSQL